MEIWKDIDNNKTHVFTNLNRCSIFGLSALYTKPNTFADSVDPDEPFQQDLHCST